MMKLGTVLYLAQSEKWNKNLFHFRWVIVNAIATKLQDSSHSSFIATARPLPFTGI